MIDKTAILYGRVTLGVNSKIEPYVIIGKHPNGEEDHNLETVIGSNCHIRSFTVIYAGSKIGDDFKSGDHAVIRENCNIGNNVVVGTHSLVLPYGNIRNNVVLHSSVLTCEYIEIGDNSWFGPGVRTFNTLYPKAFNDPRKDEMDKKGAVKIGKYVRIGGNSTIVSFVTLGDYVVVGAGSVVVKSVPDNHVVVGNPAKIIKKTNEISARYDPSIFPYRRD